LRVAVVGCGLIGESWAALFGAHGHEVVAWDPSPSTLDSLALRVAERAKTTVSRKRSAHVAGRLIIADTLEEAVSDALWIQENAPESVPAKHELYRRIEASAPPSAIIASSTSSLTWTQLSAGMQTAARLITAHPFNPPHIMPLVEIFAASPTVGARAVEFYSDLGREAVLLRKDAVGHIANRLASALWREAVNIVAEGIADVGDVDRAMIHGPGLRWSVVGAHMAYHLGGGPGGLAHYLEHLGPSQERRWAMLGSPKLTAEVRRQLIEGVEAEAGDRSLADLERDRDLRLIRVLAAREENDR
jgi:carnitine 3-dehydrogenase